MIINSLNILHEKLLTFLASKPLIRNASWMLAAEGFARVSRLITIVILGMILTPAHYGTLMLAIVCHETLRVFSRVGCGAKIIQCDESELSLLAANAGTLQWLLCLLVALVQILCADVIASYFSNPDLAPLLKWMALSHLIYPVVSVHVFLTQRQNNMRLFAKASALSISLENLSTALCVFIGMGVYAIAVAKILAAACWMWCFFNAPVQRFGLSFNLTAIHTLTTYAGKVLSSELLKVGRLQLDSFIAARLLDTHEFGLYSFARSAGVGLSQALSNGYINSLYPHLCEKFRAGQHRPATFQAYRYSSFIIAALIAQAMLAPWYIDLLFDDRWQAAAMIVSLLCLSAIPGLCLEITGTIYRANNHIAAEVTIMLLSLIFLAAAIFCSQPTTASDFALVVVVASTSWLLLCLQPLVGQFQRSSPPGSGSTIEPMPLS